MPFDRASLSAVPLRCYDDARPEIRSGDLLLCAGTSVMSRMIQRATESPWSHVALILRLDAIDRVMVLESVESIGVRAVPLSHYVRDYSGSGKGYAGEVLIARHDAFAHVSGERLHRMSQFAVDLFGHRYDTREILRIAGRIMHKSLGLSSDEVKRLQRDRAYICSEYVWECYRHLGIDLAHDARGFIAPADVADDPRVHPIFYVQVEAEMKNRSKTREYSERHEGGKVP